MIKESDYNKREETIVSVSGALELIDTIKNEIDYPSELEFLFRGEANNYPDLTSAKERFDVKGNPMNELKKNLNLYFKERNLDDFSIQSLAQHHHIPTYFLDFSTNILVALYFAVENNMNQGDGAIYYLAYASQENDYINYVRNKALSKYKLTDVDIIDKSIERIQFYLTDYYEYTLIEEMDVTQQTHDAFLFSTHEDDQEAQKSDRIKTIEEDYKNNQKQTIENLKNELRKINNNEDFIEFLISNLKEIGIKSPFIRQLFSHSTDKDKNKFGEIISNHNAWRPQKKTFIYHPIYYDKRQETQKSIFLFLREDIKLDFLYKAIIPADKKQTIKNQLNQLGINQSFIYQTLDALGKHIAETYYSKKG